eukprot:6912671-Pyramimonas_sp.AAC.1
MWPPSSKTSEALLDGRWAPPGGATSAAPGGPPHARAQEIRADLRQHGELRHASFASPLLFLFLRPLLRVGGL